MYDGAFLPALQLFAVPYGIPYFLAIASTDSPDAAAISEKLNLPAFHISAISMDVA